MNERAAKFISYLFHPIWISTILIAIVSLHNFYGYGPGKLFVISFLMALSLVTTAILPLAFTSILKNFGYVSSFEMSGTQERVIPYLFTGICTFFLAYILHSSNLYSLVSIAPIFISTGLTICISALITWAGFKISLHTTGWSGLLASIFLLSKSFYFNPLFLIIALTLVLGVVGAARLALNAHQPSEVYFGIAYGIVFQSTFIYLFLFC